MSKALSKREKNVCLWIWGNVPLDTVWVRESRLFKEKMATFDEHVIRWKWPDVDVIQKLKSSDSLADRMLGGRLDEIYGSPAESVWNEERVTDIYENNKQKDGNEKREKTERAGPITGTAESGDKDREEIDGDSPPRGD